MFGYVGLEDVDVGTFTQFFRYLLFSGRLVSNEADDSVVGITGYLAKYLELVMGVSLGQDRMQHLTELTPSPFETPVTTYDGMVTDK